MPFLTEQVWQALGQVAPNRGLPEPETAAESVCIATWPAYPAAWADAEAEQVVGLWQEVTKALRNLRAERNVPKEASIEPLLIAVEPAATRLRQGESFIRSLSPAPSSRSPLRPSGPPRLRRGLLPEVEIILPLARPDRQGRRGRAAPQGAG